MQPGRRRVFISYRAADTGYSPRLLHLTLSERLGADRVFLDAVDIAPGKDYVEGLLAGVRSSAVLLAVIGKEWLTATDLNGRRFLDNPDDWMRRELEAAFEAGVTVIPVFLDGATIPTPKDLPPSLVRLARLQGRWLRHREADKDLNAIVRAITDAAPELAASAPAAPQPHRRVVQLAVAGLVTVAGVVAAILSLLVDRHGGSAQSPGTGSPASGSGVLWHGTVTLDGDAGNTNWSLDHQAEPDIGLACAVCDPQQLMGFGGLAHWTDAGPPNPRRCSEMVAGTQVHLLDVREATGACFKTTKNRVGYLKVTSIVPGRLTLDVTVWEAS